MFGFYKRPLFMYDADPGGNGGDGAGGSGAAGGSGEDGKGKQEEKKTYTQAELDTMFADRAKQAETSAVTKLLKKYGFDKPEDLEVIVTEGKKSVEEKKTEAEKAAEKVLQLEKERDQAKTEAQAALAKATERIMAAEVTAEAVKQGFRPEAVQDVWLHVDRTKITEKDDAFEGIKEAVAAVAKAKPYWLTDPKAKPPGGTPPSRREGGSGQSVKDPAKEGGSPAVPTLRL